MAKVSASFSIVRIDDGVGISSTVFYYMATETNERPSESSAYWTDWNTAYADFGESKRFLWQKETITYTDGTVQSEIFNVSIYSSAEVVVIQYCYGDKDEPLDALYVIGTDTYVIGDSDFVIGTNIWSDEELPQVDGKYIWRRESKYNPDTEYFPTTWVVTRLTGDVGEPADVIDLTLSSQTYAKNLRLQSDLNLIKATVSLQGVYSAGTLSVFYDNNGTTTALNYITKVNSTAKDPAVSSATVFDGDVVTVSIPNTYTNPVTIQLSSVTPAGLIQKICNPVDETEYGHNYGLLSAAPTIGSTPPILYAEGKPKDFYTLRTDANTYELGPNGWVLATGISSLLVGLDDCLNSENPVDLNEHNNANGVTKLRTLITQEVISYLIKAFRVEVGEAELPASAQVGDPYLFVRIADNRAMQGYNETYSPPEFFVQSIKKTSSGSDREILFSINPTTGYVTMKNASLDGDDSSFKSSTFKTSKASGGEKTLNGSYSSLTYYYCLESNDLDPSFAEDLWDYVCTNGTDVSAPDVLVYNIPTGCKKITKGGYYNGTSIGRVFASPDIPRGIGYHVRGTIITPPSGASTALLLSYEQGATLNVAETVTSAIQDVNISSSDYKVGYLLTSAFISSLNAPKGFSMKIKSGTAYTEDSDISASTPVYTKSFTTNDYVLVTDTAIQFTNANSSTLLQVGDLVQRFNISSVTVYSSMDGIATKNIIPMDYDANNKFSIGTSTEPFGDIWGTNVYGAVFN